jgi:hypothetical protein
MIRTLSQLFDLASGKALPQEEDGPATRLNLMAGALLAATVFCAIYGLAAGSSSLSLALSNVYKVPMVLLISTLGAVPAALLCWKLSAAEYKATDLLMGLVAGNFTGALVLAASAPIVGLYYHSSTWLGGVLGLAAASVAVIVGFVVMVRGVASRVPNHVSLLPVVPTVAVMMAMEMLVMVQMIHVASPILPEVTVFDGGMDAIVGQ